MNRTQLAAIITAPAITLAVGVGLGTAIGPDPAACHQAATYTATMADQRDRMDDATRAYHDAKTAGDQDAAGMHARTYWYAADAHDATVTARDAAQAACEG
jgi:hypothetical protein